VESGERIVGFKEDKSKVNSGFPNFGKPLLNKSVSAVYPTLYSPLSTPPYISSNINSCAATILKIIVNGYTVA
jgi:hypothetical protein